MRVLSTSPRKCTVNCIDNHEIPGLDLVQSAALVDTNHGIVNLIMNDNRKKFKAHNRVTKCHTMLVQDSFLGSLLVFQWSCEKKLLDETTIKCAETRALTAIQTG